MDTVSSEPPSSEHTTYLLSECAHATTSHSGGARGALARRHSAAGRVSVLPSARWPDSVSASMVVPSSSSNARVARGVGRTRLSEAGRLEGRGVAGGWPGVGAAVGVLASLGACTRLFLVVAVGVSASVGRLLRFAGVIGGWPRRFGAGVAAPCAVAGGGAAPAVGGRPLRFPAMLGVAACFGCNVQWCEVLGDLRGFLYGVEAVAHGAGETTGAYHEGVVESAVSAATA